MTPKTTTACCVAALGLLSLSACVKLKPALDPTRFYLLAAATDLAPVEAPTSTAATPPLRLGRVELPDYLDRPGLAWRVAPNRIVYSDLDQWAERLSASVPRVLTANLLTLLGPARLLTGVHPGDGEVREIQLTVLRFDLTPAGEARMDAVCRWVDYRTRNLVAQRPLSASASFDPAAVDRSEAVAALSSCLAELAREIATSAP